MLILPFNKNLVWEETRCPICWDDFSLETPIVELECRHYFHMECLLKINSKYCQLCKIPFEKEISLTPTQRKVQSLYSKIRAAFPEFEGSKDLKTCLSICLQLEKAPQTINEVDILNVLSFLTYAKQLSRSDYQIIYCMIEDLEQAFLFFLKHPQKNSYNITEALNILDAELSALLRKNDLKELAAKHASFISRYLEDKLKEFSTDDKIYFCLDLQEIIENMKEGALLCDPDLVQSPSQKLIKYFCFLEEALQDLPISEEVQRRRVRYEKMTLERVKTSNSVKIFFEFIHLSPTQKRALSRSNEPLITAKLKADLFLILFAHLLFVSVLVLSYKI